MARYIDAEQFRGKHEVAEVNGKLNSVILYGDIVNAPTADVAPKSEVIQAILSLIDDKIKYEVELYNGFNSARPFKSLCQERVNALNDLKLIINYQFRAELMKKHTEEKE